MKNREKNEETKMKRKKMERLLARLGCGFLIVGLAFASGCGGAIDPGEAQEGILISSLPSLPGCDAKTLAPHGALTARKLAGSAGLVVIYDDGRALCIDTLEGARSELGASIGTSDVDSNPMPGLGQNARSNPMPGDPDNPGASNPMPGIDPSGSNPMPGTDPNRSRTNR